MSKDCLSPKGLGAPIIVVALLATQGAAALAYQPLTVDGLSPLELRGIPPGLNGILNVRHDALRLGWDLLGVKAEEDEFVLAIEFAKRATDGQAKLLGFRGIDFFTPQDGRHPSLELRNFAAANGVVLSSEDLQAIQALDRLEEPLRSALSRFIGAFQSLQSVAARQPPPDLMSEAAHLGVDIVVPVSEGTPNLFSARNNLLDSISELQLAIKLGGTSSTETCRPIHVPLLFSIDLSPCNNTYTFSYSLLLDAGGDDWYDNNAGGSNIWGGYFCEPIPPGGHAALVDLGGGNDLYGTPASLRFCGVNGGGYLGGTGFLLDEGGDDTYVGLYVGVNGGGGTFGAGFLLDMAGHDAYRANSGATNGGGDDGGIGFLMDLQGDDVYDGGGGGTNGGGNGAQWPGIGFLADFEGNDVYQAETTGTNGGAQGEESRGFLLDASGHDHYFAKSFGTNGGGFTGGAGFLLDASGSDTFLAGGAGANGGACSGGRGLLLDLSGDDEYFAGSHGANGGSGCQIGGIGSLLDISGTDWYQDGSVTCQDCSMVPKGVLGAQLDRTG